MANDSESISKGIIKYSISTWANLIIGFASIIITTRVVKPDDYGIITLFISASAVLMFLFSLGLDGALIRFFNEPPGGDTSTQLIYKSLFFISIFCFFFCGFSYLCFGESISNYIFGKPDKTILLLLYVYTFCQVVLRLLNIQFRMSFKAAQYNIQNILMNSVTRLLIIFAALYICTYSFILFFLTIGITILTCIYLFIQRDDILPYDRSHRLDWSVNLKHYAPFFRFALFSAPTYIVVYLNTFLPQQTILKFVGAYALGIFASTGMFSSILSAVQGGFSTFWSAYVYKNYSEKKDQIISIHDYVVFFGAIMAAGLVFFRDPIYFFIGHEYHASKAFYSLLLAAPILNFLRETTDKGVMLANRTDLSLIINSGCVLLNLALCYLTIPKYGLMGAAFSNYFSSIILYAVLTLVSQKYYKSIADSRKSATGTSFILAILFIPAMISNQIIVFAIVSLIMVCMVLLYKSEVVIMAGAIKTKLMHK